VVLRDRLGGERLPLGGPLGRHDHPLAKRLALPGRVEQMRAGASARACVVGSVSLNTVPVRLSPNTTRPDRFTHGIPKTCDARHSGFQEEKRVGDTS
jgi:hypothetical protein